MPAYPGRTAEVPETGPSSYPNHRESQPEGSSQSCGGFDSFNVFLDYLMNVHAPEAI